MQINVKNGQTEFKLTVLEKRRLREVADFMRCLAQHSAGEDEKTAADALATVATKWGKEDDDGN